MTLKEAQNYVKKTKYIIWSEDESRKLQKKLFEIGCKWKIDGQIVSHAEHPFLFVDNNLEITFVHKEACMYFDGSTHFCMLVDDIINIELEQEPKEAPKPKFDPNTLQPFDKVLVKFSDDSVWKCSLFSHIDEEEKEFPIICISGCWNCCIPYNDETKHLLGTKNEAPEFYQVWK